MYNPSLMQEPRYRHAPILPSPQEASILDWLQKEGRLIARETEDYDYADNEEEIADMLGADDGSYDDDDDDVVELDE